MSDAAHDLAALDRALVELARLRSDLAERTAEVAELHAGRLRCGRGCHACCIDGLTVFEVEAEAIRRRFGRLLRDGQPQARGACAFLDPEGACRIYEERPYVCRTQGLPLRWVEDEAAQIERRDICELNEEGPPIEALPAGDCFTLGPFEARLAALQAQLDGGERRRVALRALFEAAAGAQEPSERENR